MTAFALPAGLQRRAWIAAAVLALSTTAWSPTEAADAPPSRAKPTLAAYPGEIALQVDATDLDRRILQVQQTLPVQAGPLTLYLPRWMPGTHSPSNDINALAGLQIQAAGQRLAWQRDPLDPYAIQLVVPAGVKALDLRFQHLAPVTADGPGRVTVTRRMVNVQWETVVLYPAGWAASAVRVQPTLTLPAGWQAGTALRPIAAPATEGGKVTLRYAPVSLEMLVDSPVFAGANFRRIELEAPGAARPVVLNLVADTPELLKPSDAQIDAHKALVQQADKLYGSRHYAHYDFLLALSDELSGIGLEHHQSSENGVRTNYWEGWDKRTGSRQLLPHEYTHSWNGKFRRPADLATPDFNLPMQDSLLWLYEGQTQFWGVVLAARSGLVKPELTRDWLARTAASYDAQRGRLWRNLQDTTNEPVMARRTRKDWPSWQRGADYYSEMALVWLDADSLIREKSNGQRSLDDFARAFFGVKDGELGPLTYRFEDIVAALNAVQPHDWARFLRERLDSNGPGAPLDGFARGGWKLTYASQPTDSQKADEAEERSVDLGLSLGLSVGGGRGGQATAEGRIASVQWGSPAFDAGLTAGQQILAVGGLAYKGDRLKAAVTANTSGAAPIELLVRDGEHFRTVRIDYRGGLRYPRLVRIEGSADRLSALLAPR